MSKQHVTPTPAANDVVYDVVYDIRINERQRHYLHKAMAEFVARNPPEDLDDFGMNIPASLEDLLNPQGSVGPLLTDCINSFVL